MKARLFVGSSAESLSVAYAVQENLEHDAEVTVWPEGIFEPSRTTLQQLLAVLDGFDFAAFVFAPDDIGIIRNRAQPMTRDNIIFELGLFIARLGSDRCFFLTPRGAPDLHLPSDLLGLTPATYDSDRQDKNIVAGLGTACNRIRRVMHRMGPISNQVQAKAAVTQMAAGIAEEVREGLKAGTSAGSKRSRSERLYGELRQALEAAVSVQTNAGTSRPSNEVLTRVAALDGISLAVARAIRRVHITRTQYKRLTAHPVVGRDLRDLRRAGLLVPLVGFEGKKHVPVYWFPPGSSKRISAALSLAPKSAAPVTDEVNRALARAGFHPFPHKGGSRG